MLRRYPSAEVAASSSAARSAVVLGEGIVHFETFDAGLVPKDAGIVSHRQLDEHAFERRRDDDQHFRVVVAPARREADKDGRALAGWIPDADAKAGRPMGESGPRPPVRLSGRRPTPVSVTRIVSPSGTSNGSNTTSSTPSRVNFKCFGKHLVTAACVDRQPKGEFAHDFGMVHPRDEARLVSLGERARHFEVDEEILADRERRRRLAGQGVGAGHASGRDAIRRQRRSVP